MIDAIAHSIIAPRRDIHRHPTAGETNRQVTEYWDFGFLQRDRDLAERRHHTLRIRRAESEDHLAVGVALRHHVGAQYRPGPRQVPQRVTFQMRIDRCVEQERRPAAAAADLTDSVAGLLIDRLITRA